VTTYITTQSRLQNLYNTKQVTTFLQHKTGDNIFYNTKHITPFTSIFNTKSDLSVFSVEFYQEMYNHISYFRTNPISTVSIIINHTLVVVSAVSIIITHTMSPHPTA